MMVTVASCKGNFYFGHSCVLNYQTYPNFRNHNYCLKNTFTAYFQTFSLHLVDTYIFYPGQVLSGGSHWSCAAGSIQSFGLLLQKK